MLGRVRDRLAATAGERRADRRQRTDRRQAPNDHPLDGTQKVTYNGRPPYVFIKDPRPGDVNGHGVTAFGAGWYAITSAGNQISALQPSSGGGYGY